MSTPLGTRDWKEKGQVTYESLTSTASKSQAALLQFLKNKNIKHRSFWIVNAIQVTADEVTFAELEKRSEVDHIVPDEGLAIPPAASAAPQPEAQVRALADGTAEPHIDARVQAVPTTEWNLHAIRAPEVWADYGVLGEGIVVANLGSGAEFEHPALVRQYRGTLEGGEFDHNYNWFDLGGCPDEPCESRMPGVSGYPDGTGSVGIMVGDDHAENRIGVAPRAQWIAANICSGWLNCDIGAFIAAGEWLLAPTDLHGANPRPDLRPHVVVSTLDAFLTGTPSSLPISDIYPIVDAWVAAGIFPVAGTGSSGGCANMGLALAHYPGIYTAGVFTEYGDQSSGRGPSLFGDIKPNITAPGYGVRSANVPDLNFYKYGWPYPLYHSFEADWPAASHVAGTVALLWSAAPSLRRDVAATRDILDRSAVDVADLSCGGTDTNNNVWGEGKLDARAAMALAPLDTRGSLVGTVTDAQGNPIADARVQISGGNESREAFTKSDGSYFWSLPAGVYGLSASAFGFYPAAISNTTIENGVVTTENRTLEALPHHSISGVVRDSAGVALENITLTLSGTPIPNAQTRSDGAYTFPSVPEGTYALGAEAGGCFEPATAAVVVSGNLVSNFALTQKQDGFGYQCKLGTARGLTGETLLELSGIDASTRIPLPFPFPFYGQTYNEVNVSTSGLLSFTGTPIVDENEPVPSASYPNAAIFPFWEDLIADEGGQIYTAALGRAPERSFIVEWRNVFFYWDFELRVSFSVILSEGGGVSFEYANLGPDPLQLGNSASVGIEDEDGAIGLQYSYNQPLLRTGLAIEFSLPSNGIVHGLVTDEGEGNSVAGAIVEFSTPEGDIVRTVETGDDGRYEAELPMGTFEVRVTKGGYPAQSTTIVIAGNQTLELNFLLANASAAVAPGALVIVLEPGKIRTRALTLSNTSDRALNFTTHEVATAQNATWTDVPWLDVTPVAGALRPGRQRELFVTVDSTQLVPGKYEAAVFVQTSTPTPSIIEVPVSLIVTDSVQAINVGGRVYTDRSGEVWAADRRYTPSRGWGYVDEGFVLSSPRPITGTADPVLYRTQRAGTFAYRFDVPSGIYAVELGFAEFIRFRPDKRLFDIVIEGNPVLSAYDIVHTVGKFAANNQTFVVEVTDGSLDVEFHALEGYGMPVLNALRVVHRAVP